MLDVALAISHHLLIFALFGLLFAEQIAVRKGMDMNTVSDAAATAA